MVSLDKFNGNSNTLDDLCSRTCLLNKTKDRKLNVFSMITEIYESS